MWFISKGAVVCWPLGHSPNWDFMVEWHETLYRVQVKTTTRRTPAGRWQTMICTRGGNQSWNGVSKHFSAMRCDFLFVHVGDGRRWMIPSKYVEGTSGICLGGPKYAEWEIERGEPIPSRAPLESPA